MDPANQLLLFPSFKMCLSMKLSEGMELFLTWNSPDFYILLDWTSCNFPTSHLKKTKIKYQTDEAGTNIKQNAWILENYFCKEGNILRPLNTPLCDINWQLYWTFYKAHNLY